MIKKKIIAVIIVFSITSAYAEYVSISMDSRSYAPLKNLIQPVSPDTESSVMLSDVPTSSWTYGSSATAAGMIFGYYDRIGYSNMYEGLVPLTDLGNQTSLIATQSHIDDYWIAENRRGHDPWEKNGEEHLWADCTADFMGTNQWKWSYDLKGKVESNRDGATTLWLYSFNTSSPTSQSMEKLYDYIPNLAAGDRQTSLTHGLRLFAESRGYTVLENYSQRISQTEGDGGFTFDDYMYQIDSGAPVMIQLTGHSMVGVGYDSGDRTIFLHDTWGDYVASMTWGDSYQNMDHIAVSVIHLAEVPEPQSFAMISFGILIVLGAGRKR